MALLYYHDYIMTLRVSLLTIGDEICIGQIVNTNAAWMADQCSSIGADVRAHTSIGDEREVMLAELERLLTQSDVLLISGGLGPTHDDITKPVLCEYLGDTLVEHQPTLNALEEFFRSRKRVLSERNRGQALVPTTATVLTNPRGTAPGLLFSNIPRHPGKLMVAMPGVPAEMKGIMQEHVLPLVRNRLRDGGYTVALFKTLQVTGIPESALADLIGDTALFLEGQKLAFLPSYSGIRLRISVQAVTAAEGQGIIARIEEYIRSKAADYIIGEGDENIASAVHKELLQRGATLAVAESCTGGLLGANITEFAGSSAYFLGGVQCYSNESKMRVLGVLPETLAQYGAVSRQTAEELAAGARKRFGSDYALSITGIAGPGGGSEEKPVGTVWIGLADEHSTLAIQHFFGVERQPNRERACAAALLMLLKRLRKTA